MKIPYWVADTLILDTNLTLDQCKSLGSIVARKKKVYYNSKIHPHVANIKKIPAGVSFWITVTGEDSPLYGQLLKIEKYQDVIFQSAWTI